MAAKKPAAPRKTSGKAKPPPVAAHARAEITPEELRKLVSEAAYYRAKTRGFAPGHELEDWIQAEAEVMGRIAQDR
ncbi:MAG: oligoendopeptidase [Burkholderiales bacterium]|jgi:hypothetical protein|nr:oligoendopeptidase [Burkholderiales bacterium]